MTIRNIRYIININVIITNCLKIIISSACILHFSSKRESTERRQVRGAKVWLSGGDIGFVDSGAHTGDGSRLSPA